MARKAMTPKEAVKVLGGSARAEDHGIRWGLDEYHWYQPGADRIVLDGHFTAEQLEAFAVMMRVMRRERA